MRDEQNYENFTKFIEIIIDLDNKLYERVMKKRYDQFKNRTEFIYKSTAEHAESK